MDSCCCFKKAPRLVIVRMAYLQRLDRDVIVCVFQCKAASLTEEGGELLAKNTNIVEEIKFHDRAALL